MLPRVYGFSTLGRPLDLFLFAVPFILATSLMGQAAGAWFRAAGRVFPSESAIDGLVRINQMGASLSEVRPDWMALWALAGAYLVLSVLSARFGAPREPAGGA